jgi:hypothetical protein
MVSLDEMDGKSDAVLRSFRAFRENLHLNMRLEA